MKSKKHAEMAGKIWNKGLLMVGLAAISAATLTSCYSSHDPVSDRILAMHPKGETRMASKPRPGYVPTGVWRVQGKNCVVYIAGTSHILEEHEVPLPSTYYASYNDSEWLCMEINEVNNPIESLSKATLLPALFSMVPKVSYLGRDSLKNHVSKDTLKALKNYFGEDYVEALDYKPEGLWLFDMIHLSDKFSGVEDVFMTYAHQDGKKIQQLDSSTLAIKVGDLIERIPEIEAKRVKEMGADRYIMKALVAQNNGDENDAWQFGKVDMESMELELAEIGDRRMTTYLLKGRNELWIGKILKRLEKEDENGLVMVGAAHLPGEHGLLELLKKHGYQPVQLHGVAKPAVR